ncbi:3-hydroxyisobutyrate dehydrogenase [Fonsecaea pedrosoi CBS 271.37]|uniref:3-hydroxyisobutyrate dehydrogenase n=1 Tax=Fonsecaea pedrosoi CBS 271.37 TaxID=1442368 RepID=A0A0D2GRN6_9EURO|nr:3-hydroxyisobutyrate dehydrogenase [Fonsecaea pedrosoi CBS 271.37]KIW83633.1 3-hydroxyisobutyrate dehydrogenase [Fonsecaea pedrosoi CBS 271.37]
MGLTDFQRVGLIGLGAMGYPMAQNLARKLPVETKLVVFDISSPAVEKIAGEFPEKVERGNSAREVFSRSDAVITMLPEGHHVRSVYTGPDVHLDSECLEGRILIDSSTIDVDSSLAVRDFLKGVAPTASFYAAPVSGGVYGASAGTLAFYVGITDSDGNFETVKELLCCMGDKDKIIPCGYPASGLVAKTCNNYLSGVMNIAACEAMHLGVSAGLDPKILHRVICAGAARNGIIERSQPVPGIVPTAPSTRGYSPGFKASLMAKDVALAVKLGETSKANLVLGSTALSTYQSVLPESGDLDFTVLYRHIAKGASHQQETNGS